MVAWRHDCIKDAIEFGGGRADKLVEAEKLGRLHILASAGICGLFELFINIRSHCDSYLVRSEPLQQLGDFFEKCCRNRLRARVADCDDDSVCSGEHDATAQISKRAHLEREVLRQLL